MTDEEFKAIKLKIEREFPIRVRLAELAGHSKLNVKNHNALMEFDATIAELFLEVSLNKPENILTALSIIRGD